MIEVQNLKKTYQMGTVTVGALKGVSLLIEKGAFVGIMGPSGSGKSTLLHLLGLLDRPTSGSIRLMNTDVTCLSEEERTEFRLRNLGYVFQDYALVSELNVLENVAIPMITRGRPYEECYTAARDVLEKVDLLNRQDHLVYELSGGEQQRVSIARALVNRPAIMYADEPCANLDTENSRTILGLFRSVNRNLGQTIVMVSHEPWHREYFDRIIQIRDGMIEEMKRDTLSAGDSHHSSSESSFHG